jgi:hypothetical protein
VGAGWDAGTNMAVTFSYVPYLSRKSNDMVTTRLALG